MDVTAVCDVGGGNDGTDKAVRNAARDGVRKVRRNYEAARQGFDSRGRRQQAAAGTSVTAPVKSTDK